ncbi:MAG: hypothetical protein ACJ790_02490 [Myxococcaceae bacterium]
MAPPKKPAPPAEPPLEEFDDELTEMGFPEGDDGLGDINFDDLDNLEGVPLDQNEGTGRHIVERDAFEDSQVQTDAKKRIGGAQLQRQTAPEVSQGPWRERAFVPRGTLPREEILSGIENALKVAQLQGPGAKVDKVRSALKLELMPLLRQAVEQAGGDGIDSWISQITHPPGKKPRDLMLMELVARMDRFNRAADVRTLLIAAHEVFKSMSARLSQPTTPKLSLKTLEQELEGRVDVDVILQILFSTDDELKSRIKNVDESLEQLRIQLRGMAGMQPESLMWNFSRLKVEKRVIEAELKRRTPAR